MFVPSVMSSSCTLHFLSGAQSEGVEIETMARAFRLCSSCTHSSDGLMYQPCGRQRGSTRFVVKPEGGGVSNVVLTVLTIFGVNKNLEGGLRGARGGDNTHPEKSSTAKSCTDSQSNSNANFLVFQKLSKV